MSLNVSVVVLDQLEVSIEGCSKLENMRRISRNITLSDVPFTLVIYSTLQGSNQWILNVYVQDTIGANVTDWWLSFTLVTSSGDIELKRVNDWGSHIEESKLISNGINISKMVLNITALKYEYSQSKEIKRFKSNVNVLKLLKDTQLMSDFELLAQDKDGAEQRFRVHKNIIATHSPVFAAMLTSGMEEQTLGVMVTSEFSAEVVREVVNFMYDDVLESGFNLTLACDVLRFASMYQICTLEECCVDIIALIMTKQKAAETLQLACQLGCSLLKKSMVDYIRMHFDKIEFIQMLNDLPSSLRDEVIVAMCSDSCKLIIID